MKILLIFLIFFSSSYAKQCYKDKYKQVCYWKYFDRKSIHKAKSNETYYLSKNKSIYAFNDKVEIKFRAVGTILNILDDFEIDFFDKIQETYIFKVRHPDELFSIVSRLNELSTIKKAVPGKIRKYLKSDMASKAKIRRENIRAAREKSKNNTKNTSGTGSSNGSGASGKKSQEPRNFLNPS